MNNFLKEREEPGLFRGKVHVRLCWEQDVASLKGPGKESTITGPRAIVKLKYNIQTQQIYALYL